MNLHEYQVKKKFADYGLPVPDKTGSPEFYGQLLLDGTQGGY